MSVISRSVCKTDILRDPRVFCFPPSSSAGEEEWQLTFVNAPFSAKVEYLCRSAENGKKAKICSLRFGQSNYNAPAAAPTLHSRLSNNAHYLLTISIKNTKNMLFMFIVVHYRFGRLLSITICDAKPSSARHREKVRR